MYFGIRRAVDRVNASRSLHALVVTGTGDVFAPGGELGGQHDDGDINIGELLGTGAVPFDAIRDSRKPVIAAVNGLCMGGGLLITMLADIAIASAARGLRRARAAARGRRRVPRGDPARARRYRPRTRHALHRVAGSPRTRRSGTGSSRVSFPTSSCSPPPRRSCAISCIAAPRARVALKRLINVRYGVVDRITFDESVHGDEVVEGFTAFVEKRSPSWVPADTRPERRA